MNMNLCLLDDVLVKRSDSIDEMLKFIIRNASFYGCTAIVRDICIGYPSFMKKEENIELGIKHCIAGEQLGTLIQYKRNFDYFDEIYYRIL